MENGKGVASAHFRMPTLDELAAVPMLDVDQELQRQVKQRLADGIPVTLTNNGRAICTLYPGGRIEYPGGPRSAFDYGP